MEQLHVLNVHGAVAYGEMCKHGAVACACHQNVSLTESIAQLKDTDHTRSYDTKIYSCMHFTALKQSGR